MSHRFYGWILGGLFFGFIHGLLVHVVSISNETAFMAEVSMSLDKASYDEELLAKRLIIGCLLGAFVGGVAEQVFAIKSKREKRETRARPEKTGKGEDRTGKGDCAKKLGEGGGLT